MKIDLHVHCKERSRCGKSSESEQAAAAAAAGLDAFVFTDHSRLTPADNLVRLNDIFAPLRIFGGIELNVEGEDWIVIGLQDEKLMTEKWTYPTLHQYVREREGFIFLAHPYRYHVDISPDIVQFRPDAIELRSCNTPIVAYDQIRDLLAELKIPPVCNSDAHITHILGPYYNIVEDDPVDDRALVLALRKGFSIFPSEPPIQPDVQL